MISIALSAERSPYDLMRAIFPSGIGQRSAENSRHAGHLDTCITRTALLEDANACVQAGGWVNDSVPEEEFQETVNKSKAMLKAVALAESFFRLNK